MIRFGRFQGRAGLLALAAVALIGVAACASSGASVSTVDRGPGGAPMPAATGAPAPVVDTSTGTGTAAEGLSGGNKGSDGNQTAVSPFDALIVRSGSLALEVKDLDASILGARGRIVGLGGYVSDSERINRGDDSMALITYRIPSARWDEALDALHGLASKVVNENTKAVEVTGQVVDLTARIDNLHATEKALQAIMVQATKITDILDVQNQLTNVQGEIEQLTAQKNHLSDQAAFGTLAVQYTLPVATVVVQATDGFNFAAEVDRALAQLVQMGQGLLVAGVWLAIVGLPILLGVLVLAAIALIAVRRFGGARPGADPGVSAV